MKSEDSPPISRRGLARRLTVQAVYHWLVNETPPERLLRQFHDENSLGRADVEYFKRLLFGTVREASTLTDTFSEYLDRGLEQLDPVERAVLMTGCYELMFCPDIPWKVILNEAIGLAKIFGAEDSYKYINGVLEKVARTVRIMETGDGRRGTNGRV
ncbi:MAG: transcription antitermination factor NusB [Nevskiales bacterium]|nr:transcription antitermination factor NusB [Nevskiales bacterium]